MVDTKTLVEKGSKTQEKKTPGAVGLLERGAFDQLFQVLQAQGYTIVGPTVREGVILYDELESPDELPIGWTDEQEAGTYRMQKREDEALFGYTVGPHSWKRFLFPPKHRLFRATRGKDGFDIEEDKYDGPNYAFLGVRACELQAMAIQDNVFLGGDHVDPHYRSRRESALIIAVNCGKAGQTCFCSSMGSGPKAGTGFDLALTELISKDGHAFLLEVGSKKGNKIFKKLPIEKAGKKEQKAADAVVAEAEAQMGRQLDTEGLKDLLYRNYQNPHWEEVAEKCLSCANCTMVCPTCFCSTVEEMTDLSGDHAERWRRWDSCFTMDFTYIHGGSVRQSTRARYRQWMTHKLATWFDQFGTSGCVGCGRCITWCPVGIDLTEEARALRASDQGELQTGMQAEA
ncbi:MAG: sulfite reductase subunit A [Planctomycetota bacterium]|nr:MAG: sulfite reductase subunit A [Planctomycetota bacterium]